MIEPTPAEFAWMQRAVELARQSVPEPGRLDPTPLVGAVAVGSDGGLLGEAWRGMTSPPDHAEFALLKTLGFPSLAGATVYTTLEPCSSRGRDKVPCAVRLVNANPSTVWIGVSDTNPKVARRGWRLLNDAGIRTYDFPAELRDTINRDNRAFFDESRSGVGDTGSATLDPTQNGGRFQIQSPSGGVFETRWTQAGRDAVYAYDSDHLLGDARYATEFDHIHDPTALAWESYALRVPRGELVVFRNGSGWFALVQVVEVHDHGYDSDKDAIKIAWLVRE